LDVVGGCVSFLCAIHCLVLPLLLPFAASFIHNVWIEAGMMLAAIVVGSLALSHGFKSHGFRLPTLSFAAGMICIITGNWVITGGRPLATLATDEHSPLAIGFVALGGVLIVSAHVLNFALERRSSHRDAEIGVHGQVV
jgi:hypothetical protein